jgi:cell division protease FtsH
MLETPLGFHAIGAFLVPPKNGRDPELPFHNQRHQLPWLILGLISMVWILAIYLGPAGQVTRIPYSEFKTMIRQESFQEVALRPATVRGVTKSGKGQEPNTYEAVKPDDADLLRELDAHGIRYQVEGPNPWISYVLSWVVPVLLLFLLWRLFIGRLGGAERNLMAIGRSKAKVYVNRDTGVRRLTRE